MRIDIITIFPEVIETGSSYSIVQRARDKDVLELGVHDLRDYTHDRHRSVDDAPFGPGAGMVMKPEPLFEAVGDIRAKFGAEKTKVLLMTPQGARYNQAKAAALSLEEHLIIICGHYEGVDERVREHLVDEEISIGDFVLTGGELPALLVLDSVTRLLPGVLGHEDSAVEESFSEGLLEYPHYTRPAEYNGWQVPDILLSGHHAEIAKWRRVQSIKRTLERRPDLLERAELTKEDKKTLDRLLQERQHEEDIDADH
jgi:tRNA (guanine37-N1)-methyltransferase